MAGRGSAGAESLQNWLQNSQAAAKLWLSCGQDSAGIFCPISHSSSVVASVLSCIFDEDFRKDFCLPRDLVALGPTVIPQGRALAILALHYCARLVRNLIDTLSLRQTSTK